MKKKSDGKGGLFLVGNLGKASLLPLSLLRSHLWEAKTSGVDAVSVMLRDSKDVSAIGKISSEVKKNNLYLLADILPNYRKGDVLNADGLRSSDKVLDNEDIISLCTRRHLPLFVFIKNARIGEIKRKFYKIRRKYNFPLTFMLTACRRSYFFELFGLQRKYRSVYLGYEDTSEGVTSSLIALAWGAKVIGKPISFHAGKYAHQKSYTIEEFRVFSTLLREGVQYID